MGVMQGNAAISPRVRVSGDIWQAAAERIANLSAAWTEGLQQSHQQGLHTMPADRI